MPTINEIKIENYRGLQELHFEPARINVFIGRNNTGKSSVLEAIALAVSALNGFKDSIGTDIIETIMERRLPDSTLNFAKYFVNIHSNKSHILLKINRDLLKLRLEFFESGYPKSEVGDDFLRYLEELSSEIEFTFRSPILNELRRLTRKAKELPEKPLNELLGKFKEVVDSKREKFVSEIIKSQKIFFVASLNDEIVSEVVYLPEEAIELLPPEAVDEMLPFTESGFIRFTIHGYNAERVPILFGVSKVGELVDIKKLYSALIRKNKLSKALDVLEINIDDFDDLRELDDELVCIFQNIDGPIPLSFMGDGFIGLVRMTFISTLVENGVVMLEEPETSMHPGYLSVTAEQIAENENIQFFISTHSIELINYLLKQEILDEMKFIRMYRYADGEIGYEVLSGNEAKYELETIKADLRGT
ncbi:MAG: hypothetical protein DRO98_04540 [Archaeoglobales archaeon]|nr:MAG: hypothetical protein DRO98_04540 [Archaeoglobales archaeon]